MARHSQVKKTESKRLYKTQQNLQPDMFIQLPVISVVTPTFNRKDELVHLLSSMKKQTLILNFLK